MPELPEVETYVRTLRDGGGEYQVSVVGQEVREGVVLWPRTLALPSETEFTQRIIGQVITALERHGKFLDFFLSIDHLLIHLRMSGDLRLETAVDENDLFREYKLHDRLALVFTDNTRLVFNDTRKFGRVWLTEVPEEVTGGLGPEPLDGSLNGEKFFHLLATREHQLKPLLMDQSFLAGLGNIYTDEALHMAKLHPLMNSRDITPAQAEKLLNSIRAVLNEGIRRNGASIDWVYRGGDFQNHFRVYGRKGETCPECGTKIERLVVGQRGTHICPGCQALKQPR